MFDIETLFRFSHPGFAAQHPRLTRAVVAVARKLWKEDAFKKLEQDNPEASRVDLIGKGFESIDFQFVLSEEEKQRIPATGRLIIAANHPLGPLDGIGLIHEMRKIRPDVKLLLNPTLYEMLNMKDYTIPVDNFYGVIAKQSLKRIYQQLDNEGVVIVFPAGLTSRLTLKGVEDFPWHSGFCHFAIQKKAPILPIYIDGKNSKTYYSFEFLTRFFAYSVVFMREILQVKLIREMFSYHTHGRIAMRIGHAVALNEKDKLTREQQVQFVRDKVYQLKP